MIERWIILAAEEAGRVSNKTGGIWNVVDAEATTLARLVAKGEIASFVSWPGGPASHCRLSDWSTGRNRVTDISSFNRLEMGERTSATLDELDSQSIERHRPAGRGWRSHRLRAV